MEWGCANCHKPSWKTGDDNYVTSKYIADKKLPRYQNQTIYPYSDFIQHKLYMMNDIHGSYAAPLHFGVVAWAIWTQVQKIACTTVVPATRWKPSCGTATARRVMPIVQPWTSTKHRRAIVMQWLSSCVLSNDKILQEETKIRKAARLSKAFGSFLSEPLNIRIKSCLSPNNIVILQRKFYQDSN